MGSIDPDVAFFLRSKRKEKQQHGLHQQTLENEWMHWKYIRCSNALKKLAKF